jgi:SAM-dependent methyltransferase
LDLWSRSAILHRVPAAGTSRGSWGVKRHWEERYAARGAEGVSWFEAEPETSLTLIGELGIAHDAGIIDVGGGASRLAGRLLARGFCDITVLDLSAQSLELARSELGADSARVRWLEQDLLTWTPQRTYDLWHDRALLHFLVQGAERDRYVATLRAAVSAGGRAMIGAFASDGPDHCSGLPVCRYDAHELAAVIGAPFSLLTSRREAHRTPSNALQPFTWVALERSS